MRYLPLYEDFPRSASDTSERLDVDPSCTRCQLSAGARNACLAADGAPGGVLVVGEYPGRVEDAIGRPHTGDGGKKLRELVAKYWTGPAAFDYALRCHPGKTEVKPKHVEFCRPYLARVVDEVAPLRVIAVGSAAAYALFGRSVQARENRRGYAYLFPQDGRPIPVFFLQSFGGAARNRFLRRYFEEDLAWALRCSLPELPPIDADARVVETRGDAEDAVADLRAHSTVDAPASFDVETCGRLFDPSFRILSLSCCGAGESDAWVWDRAALEDPTVRAPLLAWLADASAPKTGTNVKYDELACWSAWGIDVRCVRGDVRLHRKLLAADASGALDKMVEHVGMGGMKEENEAAMEPVVARVRKGLEVERRLTKQREEDAAIARSGSAPKKRAPLRPEARAGLEELHRIDREMPDLARLVRDPDVEWRAWAYALVPPDVLTRYNARDAVGTERVRAWVEPQLRADPDLDAVRAKIVDRAAHAVRKVEGWGILVDRPALENFDAYLAAQLAPVRARLDTMAGPDFNPLSPPQCGELLFGRLGLQHDKKTRTGKQSTDGDVLEEIASKHPVAHAILEYRTIAKMRGTYASGMIPHIRHDGRVHTSILLDGAESGRTSSQNPNLQNIPRAKDSPEGKMARDVFIARPGYFLLELDYSQLEYRIAAMLSKDPVMRRIFEEGHDCHQRTAELISQIAWGIPPSAVTEVHRTKAKAVNFAILYGKTARTLSHEWGISLPATERVVNAITGNFKVLSAWCGEMLARLRKNGEIQTWWAGRPGRRRPLWRVADPEDGIRRHAENSAVNTPVQGTASEFCVASLAEVVEWVEGDGIEEDCRPVLPIHDALLIEVRRELVVEAAETVRAIMLSHDSDGVPLEVDAKVGRAFGSMVKFPVGDRAGCRAVLEKLVA